MKNKVLIVVDIQKELETKGRAYFIENLNDSLKNASQLLDHARKNGWTVYHMQHLQDGDLYGYNSPLSKFVDGFEPLPGEQLFTKGNYSCFSSPEFAEAMKQHIDDEIIMIGYGSTKCVLSTIVDGYHRGYQITLVTDATGAQASSIANAESTHRSATEILSAYCRPMVTEQLL